MEKWKCRNAILFISSAILGEMCQRSGSGSARSCFDRELEEPAFCVACLAGFCTCGGDGDAGVGADASGAAGSSTTAAVCLAVAGVAAPAFADFLVSTIVVFRAVGESFT